MTVSEAKEKEKQHSSGVCTLLTSVAFTSLIFLVAIFLSDEIAEYVRHGLLISVNVIIPSVLPFLLLGDFCARFIHFECAAIFRRIFEKLFRINGAALPVFICGILCGFPVGAQLAITMYKNGKISENECERLISFANNASPGYVICAVGLGMRDSLLDGFLLYTSMVTSSVITGILIGINKDKSNISNFIMWQKYSFIESVKSSSIVCLQISAFVSVFSVAVGLMDKMIGSIIVKAAVIPLLEIGNAAAYLSDLCIFPPGVSLALTAFAISFSGLCVCAQTLSLIDNESDISFRKYIPYKLIQGFISALIILLSSIIKGL